MWDIASEVRCEAVYGKYIAKLSSSWQFQFKLSRVSFIIAVPVELTRADRNRPPGIVENQHSIL